MQIEGFKRTEIKTSGARIVTVAGGSGPPLLLMHGNPFTHLSWLKVAPALAREFTVVCTDLRGYGDSRKAARRRGSFRLFVPRHGAGPGRGDGGAWLRQVLRRRPRPRRARAASHVSRSPRKVTRAAILDIIPQHHLLNNMTREWGRFSWHWLFNIQPEPLPEKMMGADPDWFIEKKLAKTKQGLSFFDKDALAEYKRCFRNPETIHAICEDYRACFGVDLDMDTKDFEAGRKIECPVLLLWGATGGVGRNSKPAPAEIWQRYASNIVGAQALPCGHYLSEEAPKETTAALREFFAA